ncbi:MAG: helix-turn-helix domain-containing protein [Suipraeoptans sp.]
MKMLSIKLHLNKPFAFFLRSYIIMMVVAMLITIFGYSYSYWIIHEDIKTNYSAILNSEKQTYDKEWASISANLDSLAANVLLKKFAQVDKWSMNDLYDSTNLVTELDAICKSHEIMDSLGVYFFNDQSIVTNEKRYGGPVNYLYLQEYHLSVDEFLSNLTDFKGYFIVDNGNKRLMVLYQNVYDNRGKSVIATTFCIMPWYNISQAVSDVFAEKNGGTFIVNSKKQILGNDNINVDILKTGYEDLVSNDIMYNVKMNNKDYIMSALESDVLDLYYAIFVPKSILLRNIFIYKYILLVEILLYIFVGGFLALRFSRRNYLPIERLLKLLKVQKRDKMDSSSSQIYQNLEESLQQLVVGNDQLLKQLNSHDIVIDKYIFTSLMKGWNMITDVNDDILFRIKKKYPFAGYRIVLFSLNNIEKSVFAPQERDKQKPTDYSLMIFSLKNVIEEILLTYDCTDIADTKTENGIVIEMGDMVACIFNQPNGYVKEMVQKSIIKCMEFFKSAFLLDTYTAISGVHKELEELDVAYDEALMAITHKSFWSNSLEDIIVFDDEKLGSSEHPAEMRLNLQAKKLSNCLLMKDYKKASEVLDETLEKCFSKDINKLSYNQFQAVTLISIVLTNLSEVDYFPNGLLAATNWTSSDGIFSMKSIKDIKTNLHQILKEISEKYNRDSAGTEEPCWIKKAEEYVKVHYMEEDLNISSISDKFDISLSHIGRTYKKLRGISLLDYIHQLRIEKCKQLIDQGMTVTECANIVGYIDAKSLIRAFRRYEGITPGQYKLKLRDADTNKGL